MVYNFKEYRPKFDTPMKRQQEIAIARKIMNLLNKNKYDNLEEFISKNSNYQNFLKSQNMDTVVKHFGNTLKEEDYINILENLKALSKDKQQFERENIQTTNIDDKQYNTFKGEDKTYYIDNSHSGKSIEEQLKALQQAQQSFQTTDQKQNTENMFKELERKKDTLNLQYLHEINFDLLNNEEKEMYLSADNYQQSGDGIIRVDLKKGVIVDEQDNIMKIQKENGKLTIIKEENGVEKNVEIKEKSFQKTLKPTSNTIYSN